MLLLPPIKFEGSGYTVQIDDVDLFPVDCAAQEDRPQRFHHGLHIVRVNDHEGAFVITAIEGALDQFVMVAGRYFRSQHSALEGYQSRYPVRVFAGCHPA